LNSRIIINADDLGISKDVNDAIFKCALDGAITSATIISNAPFFNHFINNGLKVGLFNNISLGVHLNLTEFKPITHSVCFSDITTSEGLFNGKIRSSKASFNLIKGIYFEWCAQVDKVLELNIDISHFDSHHHVHTMPILFIPLKLLQIKYGIKKVRISRNIFIDRSGGLFFKNIFNYCIKYIYNTRTTDYFTDLCSFLSSDIYIENSKQNSCRIIELMLHPGHVDFHSENQLLNKQTLKSLSKKFELINYHQL
jgi:chitin disaccharide deacetylase